MKRILLGILALIALNAMAAEKKPIADIDINALTSETQTTPANAPDKHVSLVWWMPIEFWHASFVKNGKMSPSQERDMMDAFSGVSIIAIAEADVSSLATFDYYAKDDVEKNLVVTYTDSNGDRHVLQAQKTMSQKLGVVLGIMKPILSSAVGNLGSNLNFFVFDDLVKAKPHTRLIDPYTQGGVDIQLTTKDGVVTDARIGLPLDALFVPRMCPGDRKAHVSWKYCPWDGTPLKD